jgi:hypothetical protein
VGRFILVLEVSLHDLVCYLALGLWQHIMVGACGGVKLLTKWLVSKQEEIKGAKVLLSPSRAFPQ